VLRYLRDNFQHAPSADLQATVVNCLVHLMLSQARECVLERTLLERDNSSPGDQTDGLLLRHVELAQECSTVSRFRRSFALFSCSRDTAGFFG